MPVLSVWASQYWNVTNPGGNAAHNGYPSRIATTKPPTQNGVVGTDIAAAGDGVIPCGFGGAESTPYIYLLPYGVGADDTTFSMTVLGWRPTNLGNGVSLWIPVPLIAYACTLSANTGVSGSDLGTTQQFVDAITSTGGPTFITTGAAPVILDWFQISGAADSNGMIKQPTFGFPYLEVIFTTGGSATSCNALWCPG